MTNNFFFFFFCDARAWSYGGLGVSPTLAALKMADDFDIFNFGGRPGGKRDKASGPTRLAQRRGSRPGNAPTSSVPEKASESESDGDDNGETRVKRRHRRYSKSSLMSQRV